MSGIKGVNAGEKNWHYKISGDGENWSTGYHITHWMTLPEKPKED